MKKFILSTIILLSFGFYVIWQGSSSYSNNLNVPSVVSLNDPNSNGNIKPLANTPITPSTPAAQVSSFFSNIFSEDDNSSGGDNSSARVLNKVNIPKTTPIVKTSSSNSTIPISISKGIYKDGTYLGDSAFAYSEDVQVEAIITNGKLSDIKFAKYPTRGRSGNISSFSLPVLKQEAIVAQSANIDAVSGASYTSPAFIESLASALNQAKV